MPKRSRATQIVNVSLSAQGRADAERLGLFLRSKETAQPSVVWCSPYRRAQETAAIILNAWGGTVEQRREEACLEPDITPASVAEGLFAVAARRARRWA